jgi:hypothetical protein
MRTVGRIETGQHVEQGDLLIVKIGEHDALYKPAEIIKDGILALGEATGHAHRAVATLERMGELLKEDQDFLEKVQKGLDDPIVFKDKDTVRRTVSVQGAEVVVDVVCKIHARTPFLVVHYSNATRALPPDDLKTLVQRNLHELIQLPAGLYEVHGQTQYFDNPRRVVD